jgi:hypothetical protein
VSTRLEVRPLVVRFSTSKRIDATPARLECSGPGLSES